MTSFKLVGDLQECLPLYIIVWLSLKWFGPLLNVYGATECSTTHISAYRVYILASKEYLHQQTFWQSTECPLCPAWMLPLLALCCQHICSLSALNFHMNWTVYPYKTFCLSILIYTPYRLRIISHINHYDYLLPAQVTQVLDSHLIL